MPASVCVYDNICISNCASVEIYYMYKPESWYKLRGGRILVQITPLQDFGTERGGGGTFTTGLAYTRSVTVHVAVASSSMFVWWCACYLARMHSFKRNEYELLVVCMAIYCRLCSC